MAGCNGLSTSICPAPACPQGWRMDNTRDMGRLIQSGVRSAEQWQWGPFWAARTELSAGIIWAAGITIGAHSFTIGMSEALA